MCGSWTRSLPVPERERGRLSEVLLKASRWATLLYCRYSSPLASETAVKHGEDHTLLEILSMWVRGGSPFCFSGEESYAYSWMSLRDEHPER